MPFGYVATEKEYSHFHLRLEYKWGTKVCSANAKRDAGILYHLAGDDKVWPQSSNARSWRATPAISLPSAPR